MNEKKHTRIDEVLIRLQTNPDVAKGRLNPALRAISERCLNVLEVDRVNIWKMSPQEDVFQNLDSYDQSLKIHSSGEIIPIHQCPVFMASLQSERFIGAKDVHNDHRTMELSGDLWKPLNIASALIVPVRIRGKLEGMVRFEQSRAKHNWAADEETFACQIGEIIADVFLIHENNEKVEQLQAHENTIAEMSRLTNFHTMLTEALHRAIELTGARSAMLYENIPSRREIQCLISLNTPISFSGIVLKYGDGAAATVAEVGRSLRIQDYRMWSGRASQLEEQYPFTSVLAVPIRFQGRISGVIELAHHDITSHFTEDHLKVLEDFAHNFSVILEHRQLTKRIGGVEVHNQLLQQIISTSSLAGRTDSYLESILKITLKRFGLGRGILRMEQTAVMQEMSEEEETQINERMASDQAGFNAEINVADWREYSGSYTALASLFSTMDIKASLFVPLWDQDEYKGYLAVFCTSPREWHDDEIAIMQLVAKQVVLTIEKIKGDHDRENFKESLARLNVITSDLNRLFTFEDAIERVGQGAMELIHAEHAAMFLKNPDGSLSVPWHFAVADTHVLKMVPGENKDLVQLLLGSAKPVAYQNLKSTPLPALFKKYMTGSAIATSVCLPLVYSNETVGTIVTFHNFSRNLSDIECDLLEAFTNQAAVTLQNAWMFEQLDKGYTDLALSLAHAIDTRKSSANDHTQRVAKWAEDTGRKLGLNDQEIRDLHWAALLHDIGKSSIPNEILGKSGPLNEEERKVIQKHPEIGADMIQPLSRFQTVSDIIRSYRERYDGNGYPSGLKGDDIPLSARVLAVADAYGSIINERPYHRARSEEEALHELESGAGNQFDPIVVKSFMELVHPVIPVGNKKQKSRQEKSIEK